MAGTIPESFRRLLRDRRSLLWVCQRYDLLAGESPHGFDVSGADATLRYRSEPDELDRALAVLYWEAIWLEGARSPLLAALSQALEGEPLSSRRPVVVLASESDARAQVSPQEFLPVCVLPGVIDSNASPDARYGSVRPRQRERIAWSLGERITALPGRVLVILGAKEEADLERLYELLENRPITGLQILLVWPIERTPPQPPANPAVVFHIWPGSTGELITALRTAGAPSARELPRWGVRVGRGTVELTADEVRRVLERFALLTERHLIPPDRFDIEDLQDFLAGSLENWAGFAMGLPVRRAYTSGANLSLVEEVSKALGHLSGQVGSQMTFILRLPCEGGSGATTMLREAAFRAAAEGYPTLIMRPDQVDFDVEDLVAFGTSISEAALGAGITDIPPLLVVLDVEHARLQGTRQLPQALASRGRRAVILQAEPCENRQAPEKRGNQRVTFRPLLAETEPIEVEWCEQSLQQLVQRWALPIEVPTLQQWRNYELSTRWRALSEGNDSTSLFWVALRYFLTEGMDLVAAERARGLLGAWIARRAAAVSDPDMQKVVASVAALSALRIACPLWTALRPVTGGTFTSKVVETLKQISDIVVWGEYSQDLEDHVLRFAHPILAEEYLRQQGAFTRGEQLTVMTHMLAALSQGRPGDVWVAESLATTFPAYEERQITDWDWYLNVFEMLPPLVRESSKTILHHWARCLYQSADSVCVPPLLPTERRARFEKAIEKLERAIQLPRRPGREEHPSHIYNTLGTAYSRYARFLKDAVGDSGGETMAWARACLAFERSIALSDGANIEALLAFSQRLLYHAKPEYDSTLSDRQVRDVNYALSLLDEVNELLQEYENPNEHWREDLRRFQMEGLTRLRASAAKDFIYRLKESEEAELGYQLEARLALADPDPELGLARALEILDNAERDGVILGQRSTAFRISLLRKHPSERYNFPLLRRLYQQVESNSNYVPSALDAFRHAVLCYQVGAYPEGAERFLRLRDRSRRSGITPLRVRDLWRDPTDPRRPRATHIRVLRILTEWRAEGYVDDLKRAVPLRPRHFSPPPKENEVVACVIRFELNGPLAVPVRFEEREEYGRGRHPGETN